MKTFKINIKEDQLNDLVSRLKNTRWPDRISGSAWEYGADLNYMKDLCSYWSTNFNWKEQEKSLNQFNHFLTDIDGQSVHFIYQKGNGKRNLPLLLLHGWPDSFYRFHKIINTLTEPDQDGVAYDVIVPSIPGYGFSASATAPGFGPAKIASIFFQLIHDTLGYNRFFVHGGDWGASIATQMAIQQPHAVQGLHLTNVPPELFYFSNPSDFNEEEKRYLDKAIQMQKKEGGYLAIQGSKPQTLAYGLNDSPSGLAAWITDKFHSWTSHNGNMEEALTKDELLTNLSIYWFTQTAGSAARLYYEAMNQRPIDVVSRIEVPTWFASYPEDSIRIPESFARRMYNVQRWKSQQQGGHFPALEVPHLFVQEIRQALGNH